MDFKVDIKKDYRGEMRKYFMKVKVIRWTQEELVGVRNCQGWFQGWV